jgi:hypothetical protein
MKTISFEMQCLDISEETRLYNDVYRYAYNRFRGGLKEKEVRSKCNDLWKGKLNSWFLQCAIKDASALNVRIGEKKVIFGGKHNLVQLMKGLISKEEYKCNKQIPICSQGEMLHNGNRLFNFHFDQGLMTLKISKNKHIDIQLPHFHNKWREELLALQSLIDQKKATISVKISSNRIWLTYDERRLSETKQFEYMKQHRIMGLDLNPNYIGVSILDFNKDNSFKVVHKKVFDVSELNKTSKKESTDKKSIYLTNKRTFELIEICQNIKDLIGEWHCSKLAIEDLNIKSSNKGKGKHFNRLCNNVWKKNLVVDKLKMLANVHGFELVEVMPQYSSTIGNVKYGNNSTPDMVASSIEIARRGFKKFEKGWFWTKLNIDVLDERWKHTLLGVKDWKEAHLKIKNLKLKYRVPLLDCIQNAVSRQICKQSMWKVYAFE